MRSSHFKMSDMKSDFDVVALFAAIDAKRRLLGPSWSGVAKALWDASDQLNRRDICWGFTT